VPDTNVVRIVVSPASGASGVGLIGELASEALKRDYSLTT